MAQIFEDAQELADMSVEEYRAIIDRGLEENVYPKVQDPMDLVIQLGGFKTHPEHLEPTLKMVEWSVQYLMEAGFTLDENTLEWTPPPSKSQRQAVENLREQWAAHQERLQASQPARPVLELVDDTDPTDVARPVA